jgi:mRNA-degrading endonuclease YafQ of YafQ-DinJ toxin-antitoxin module
MELLYKPAFFRDLKKLETELQECVFAKIEEFKNRNNHASLKVHKLHGRLEGFYSFSVDYSNRIIFTYGDTKSIARLHGVGDHTIYG